MAKNDQGLPTAPQHGPGVGSSGSVPPPVKPPSTTRAPNLPDGPNIDSPNPGEYADIAEPSRSMPRSKF